MYIALLSRFCNFFFSDFNCIFSKKPTAVGLYDRQYKISSRVLDDSMTLKCYVFFLKSLIGCFRTKRKRKRKHSIR